MVSSKDSIIDYIADKINIDPNFATSILNRINAKSLHNRILSTSTTDEKHQLLIDIVDRMVSMNTNDNESIIALLSKIFAKFDFTPEQFHELTKLHILKTIERGAGDVPSN